MNEDKAYVLGMLVGAGTIANNKFFIELPLKKWGLNVKNIQDLSTDLVNKVRLRFLGAYNININFKIQTAGDWTIESTDDDIGPVVEDLKSHGLPYEGRLLERAELKKVKKIISVQLAESFLTGIFDARGSLAESHRRFNSGAPVVSLEVPGSTMNYEFVVGVCSWLTDLGSVTDQILYNHPSQHASSDPDYSGWKKGFKIRFLARSFLTSNSFGFISKARDIIKQSKKQVVSEQPPCKNRKISPNVVSIHKDIKTEDLPAKVRGKVFLHYLHICASMGCPHAPLSEVSKAVSNPSDNILFFPKLKKGLFPEIFSYFEKTLEDGKLGPELLDPSYLSVGDAAMMYAEKRYLDINSALAYLFSNSLNGKRHVGNASVIIINNKNKKIKVIKPALKGNPPILIVNESNNRAAFLSAIGDYNDKMISQSIIKSGIDLNVL